MTKKNTSILITGGTGFIGSYLVKKLLQEAYTITLLSRYSSNKKREKHKNISYITSLNNTKEHFDIIINLAGESIAQRWTIQAKENILKSRLTITEEIIKYIQNSPKKPQLLISSSAIGIYGTSQTETFDENSPLCQSDFTSKVCIQWENKAKEALSDDTRVVLLRTGIVLGVEGGALQKMLRPFKFFVGGNISSSKQYMSWIDRKDMIAIIEFIIKTPTIHGLVNATSPYPVSNREFTKTLAKVLRRPSFCTIPSFVLELIFGKEMSRELLIEGQKVLPSKVLQEGYIFKYERLSNSLNHLLKKI